MNKRETKTFKPVIAALRTALASSRKALFAAHRAEQLARKAAPLLAFLLISCTHISHPTAGTYTSLGSDTTGMRADASGFHFADNKNSPAFIKASDDAAKIGAKLINGALISSGISALESVGGSAVEALK